MEFTEPSSKGYTIYSKSGCTYCTKVKEILKALGESYEMVNCDEYLLEDREGFLTFIKERAGRDYKTFPMVFAAGKFLGGFSETKASLDGKSD